MRTGLRIGVLLVVLAAMVLVPNLLPSTRGLARSIVAPVEAFLGPFAMVGLNLIPLLFVIGVVVAVARLVGREAPSGRAHTSADEEESRLIQDLHRGFSRIEERIEALETILIERHRRVR